MSSTVTTDATSPAGTSASSGVPMGRLIRVELRKLTDTRAGKWLLIAIAAITVLVVVIALFTAKASELTYDNFTGFAGIPQGILLPVLGILVVTSEWSQRTGLVTFTLVPSRARVLVAKLVATVIMGIIALVIAFSAAALGNLLAMAFRGTDSSWTFGAEGFLDINVGQLQGLIQGVAFGMLLLNSAAAIVTYFALPIAWSLLFNLVASLRDIAPWVDLGTAQQPLFAHHMTAENWAQLAVTTLVWIALPLAIGWWRVLRSELKSA